MEVRGAQWKCTVGDFRLGVSNHWTGLEPRFCAIMGKKINKIPFRAHCMRMVRAKELVTGDITA